MVGKFSWWEKNYFLDKVDVTILGAGIVGISTAIELKQMDPNLEILIIDKKTIPIGASTKNAGFACFGSVSEILDDIDQFGEGICHKLIAMRARGLSILKSRVSLSDMDYMDEPGIEIFDADEEENYLSKLPFINDIIQNILGEKDCFSSRVGKYGTEVVNRLEGSLNPQKMMANLELLARNLGVKFLQGVNVENIDLSGSKLLTKIGEFSYKKLIVCTNGFSSVLFPDKNIQPARNQVIITKPVDGFALDGCYHMYKGYVYFREIGGRLLLGGGRHINKTKETTQNLENTDEIIYYLKTLATTKILKGVDFEIDHIWSGILGVGREKMPLVEYVNNNVLLAIRMGGMGVAVGSYIGRVAASILLDDDNRDRNLFVRS